MQVRYFVQSLAKGKYAVDAELSGNAAGCKLYSPDAFGPANEFFAAFSHFSYVDAGGKTRRLARRRGRREIELPAAAVRFSYQVSLRRRRSLLEQMHQARLRSRFSFMLGLALFPQVSTAATVEVEWDQTVFCGLVGSGLRFSFAESRELMLAPFVLGDWRVWQADGQQWRWLCPAVDAKALQNSGDCFADLVAACSDWFGGPPAPGPLTCYTWIETQAAGGMGYSFRGNCVCVFARRQPTADRQWLVLHELVHQWVGVSIRAAEPSQGWFFEGFVTGLTHLLLIRLGLDEPQRMRQALCDTLQRYVASDRRDETAQGLLLFCRFADWMNRRQPDNLRQWWRQFWLKHQGLTISDAAVRQAIAETGYQDGAPPENREMLLDLMLRVLYRQSKEISLPLQKYNSKNTSDSRTAGRKQ